MGKLVINQSFVTDETVKELEKVCPFNAFEYDGNELTINASCRSCKQCVKRGPSGVITYVEEKEVITINKDEWVGLTVFVEMEFGKIHPVVYELIGKAKELAEKINHPLYAVMVASKEQVEKNAHKLLNYGVDKVFVYQDEIYENFNIDRTFNCIKDFVEKIKPSVILYGGTSLGRSFAPKVAAHFKTGLTADCTSLGIKDNTDLVQVRPAFGGNVYATIVCPNNLPQISTVRPGVMLPVKDSNKEKEVIKFEFSPLKPQSIKLVKEIKETKTVELIENSKLLVSFGRGIGSDTNIELGKELSRTLKGTYSCSRALVDEKRVEQPRQVGQTGKTVKPDVYLALGISGAIQHLVGMENSDYIIAINKDKTAPIFNVADIGIVGDVNQILPLLNKRIKEELEK